MRQLLHRIGLLALLAIPVIYAIEIYVKQDLPPVPIWKWAILAATLLLLYFSRSRDEVFKHRVV